MFKSDPAALVAKLENKKAEARSEAERLKAELGDLTLAAEEGVSGSGAKLEKARKALDAAERMATDMEAALSVAKVRHAKALEEQAKAETARKWEAISELAETRERLGLEIEADTTALLSKFNRLLELGNQMHELAPMKPAYFRDSWLGSDRLIHAFRSFMVKHGAPWAIRTIESPEEIKPFSVRVTEGNAWLLPRKERKSS